LNNRKCDRKFSAKNLYIAFPSIITNATGEVSIKTFEAIDFKVVEQSVIFKQETDDAIFVSKEENCYVGIDELGSGDIILYDAAELKEKGLMRNDVDKKYVNVVVGDISLVAELDFISTLGKLTVKDRLHFLKHPFSSGSTALKKTYLDMQLRLKDTYTAEDLEEIVYHINQLKPLPKQVQKQYLIHFKNEDYLVDETAEKPKLLKHKL